MHMLLLALDSAKTSGIPYSDAVQSLVLYGPMALFVIVVFVLLAKAKVRKEDDPEERRVQLVIYKLVWLSLVVLGAIIIVVYWKVNFPKEFVASGKITNLRTPITISTEQDLFLHRKTVAGTHFEYEWRIISSQRLDDENIELILQKDPKDSTVLDYQVPVSKAFYSGNVEIAYDPSNDLMVLKVPNKPEFLIKPTSDVARERYAETTQAGVVYAQSSPKASPDDLILALDADDPLIRRSARRDLVSWGQRAIPQLSAVITNQSSSPRLRLGALATLGDMGPSVIGTLNEDARCAILRSTRDQDPTMQSEASALLSMGARPGASCTSQPVPNVAQAPKVAQVQSASMPTAAAAVFRKDNWHPIDMAANAESGVFVLDDTGAVFRVALDGGRLSLSKITNLTLRSSNGYISVTEDALFVLTDSPVGCTVFRYLFGPRSTSTRTFITSPGSTRRHCGGIATNGDAVYVLLPREEVVKYWLHWDTDKTQTINTNRIADQATSMVFDSFDKRILVAESSGELYSAKLNSGSPPLGKATKLADNTKANGLAIAAGRDYIFVASGKEVVSVRKGNAKISEGIDAGQFTAQGDIVGLAVDEGGKLWVADRTGIIKGPIVVK